MPRATFTLELEVDDVETLYQSAVRAGSVNVGYFDIQSLRSDNGTVDIPECIRAIFDPGLSPDGTSINFSYCEVCYDEPIPTPEVENLYED